ncbi:MAG: metallophosphoesterase family protein [Pseudomonadota bacterium]
MVFKRLFGIAKETPPCVWNAPAGQRIYAVGDIHGRRDLLDNLLSLIDADDEARGPAQTQLIFLGDLIDRGNDSRGVVERLIQLQKASGNVRLLTGNHEELLIRVYDGDKRATSLFHRVGGRETMLSYGMSEADYDAVDLSELAELIPNHVPKAHIDFLTGFDDWIEAGDYLFVHAGIRPGLAIEEQETSDLRWIRRDFTEHRGAFSHMVIHGHTITEGVDEQPNRIGIDTGAFATGKLTAIGLEGSERWFLST